MLEERPSPRATETAVVVRVPEVDPVVAEHRRDLDHAASWGVPAHVTVVYPFLPPQRVDDDALRRLAAAVGSVEAFDCTFARTDWFGEDAVWLVPEPDAPFRALTRSVWNAFPECPPYGGVHGEPTPHLTLGERGRGTPAALRAAETAVRPRLPVRARIAQALLIAGAPEPDAWGVVRRFPLAGAAPDGGTDHAARHD
jgi:2'-5' RNA ligase